jgi:hypothetical protein
MRTCTYREVLVIQYITVPSLNYSGGVAVFVRPSDGKVRIELETSTRAMSCNILLQDNTRHTRALPILTYE